MTEARHSFNASSACSPAARLCANGNWGRTHGLNRTPHLPRARPSRERCMNQNKTIHRIKTKKQPKLLRLGCRGGV